jgi:cytochrome c553
MKRLILAGAGLLACGVAASAQALDARVLAMSCLNCHGPGGASPGEIPKINGKTETSLKMTMIDFRDGKRAATVMTRLMKGYTDAEIEAIAKYVATLK